MLSTLLNIKKMEIVYSDGSISTNSRNIKREEDFAIMAKSWTLRTWMNSLLHRPTEVLDSNFTDQFHDYFAAKKRSCRNDDKNCSRLEKQYIRQKSSKAARAHAMLSNVLRLCWWVTTIGTFPGIYTRTSDHVKPCALGTSVRASSST